MGSVVERKQPKKRGRGRPKRMDIVSEANNRDHWTTKRKRRILHDHLIRKYWSWKKPINLKLPCIIILSRVAMRKLDDDNLQTALKGIRDTIADLILPGLSKGKADGDPRLKWEYGQIRGPKGLRIEIYTNPHEENHEVYESIETLKTKDKKDVQ